MTKFEFFSAKMLLTQDQLRQIKGGTENDVAYNLDRMVEQTGAENTRS